MSDRFKEAAPIAVALAFDYGLGEPPAAVHPVVWIGRAIAWFQRTRARNNPPLELASGALVTAAVCATAYAAGAEVERIARCLPAPLDSLWRGAWLKSMLSARELERAALRCAGSLEADDLDQAREDLQWLVSRDRSNLSSTEIAAAAVESAAENASDSIVAPLLAYACFGLPGAFAYRAINTLDAMIGYRGEYEFAGKVAARIDDIANVIPSRLTALLICAASGSRCRPACSAMLRDHSRTASPNAGWPMAAMAGSLGIELNKPGHYVLNSSGEAAEAKDIRASVGLMRAVVIGAVVIAGAVCALLRSRDSGGRGR
jgi:adenosylcobinamide-phosphate synthase